MRDDGGAVLERLVCMAWDAFRLCLGVPLRNHSPAEVVSFVERAAVQSGVER